jgi:large subunit ribosomal protein L11
MNMAELQKISALVTGGQASAGPPLGPSLGPMGVNIMEVINTINEKTKDFEGMKVPVTVSVSALILKEAGIQKGSGTSGASWVGDIGVDEIVKVAKTKFEKSYANSLKSAAKEIVGTCLCLGIKVEGKSPKEFTAEINAGKWDEKFK